MVLFFIENAMIYYELYVNNSIHGFWVSLTFIHSYRDRLLIIFQDLNHWVTGWTDWNMALSMKGGPNWVSNFDNSPIYVNATAKEFYKQPAFYAMGHFR